MTALRAILAWALLLALRAGAVEVAPGAPQTLAAPQAVSLAAPTGQVMLERAAAQGVALPQIAKAIQAAPDLPGAETALERLRLAAPGEIKSPAALRDALQTLWGEASRDIKEGPTDPSWAVPALVVQAGARSYYIHPVAHAQGRGGRRAARALAWQVRSLGRPLIVEQNLPGAYGLRYGRQVVDDPSALMPRWRAALQAALPLGARFQSWLFGSIAQRAERRGLADMARFYRLAAEAARLPSQERYRRLELPLPLKESVEPKVVARSRALARAAWMSEGTDIHVLTGWAHALDLVELLSPKS